MGWATNFQAPAEEEPARTAAPVGPGLIAPADGTAQPTGGANINIQQEAQKFLAGKPAGPETLQALKAHLASMGVTIEIPTRAGGTALSNDKIVLPNQQVIDVFGDEGGANALQWGDSGFWVNGQPSSTPGVVTPFAPEGGVGFGGSLNGMGSGYLATPWGGSVEMPDPAKMMADPAYQWTLSRSLDGLDKSHAARGTILSGGAGKDAMEFASGLATDTWDKQFGRGLQVADFNRGTHWGDTDRIFGRFNTLTGIGQRAAGDFADNVSSIYQGQANANAQNTLTQGNRWGTLAGLGADLLGGYFAGRG